MTAFIDTDKTISAETCPMCNTPYPADLGNFYHCRECHYQWSVDLDVTETHPTVILLREWLADESGYDERVWPTVKLAVEENRLSDRPRFADTDATEARSE